MKSYIAVRAGREALTGGEAPLNPGMRSRLGLVTLEQMLQALVQAVENPLSGVRVLGVPEIRRGTFDMPTPAVTI